MALTSTTTVLLEKQYLYVRASKGFILEGMSTERIWTNTGYYRFLTDNVAKTLGNSYINILHDPDDTDFIAYCSDLFLEELQNSVTVAVENIESVVEDFAEANHEDITSLGEGVSGALEVIFNAISKVGTPFNFDSVGAKNVIKATPSFSSSSYVGLNSINTLLFDYSSNPLDVGEFNLFHIGFSHTSVNGEFYNYIIKNCSVFNTALTSDDSRAYVFIGSDGTYQEAKYNKPAFLIPFVMYKVVRVA